MKRQRYQKPTFSSFEKDSEEHSLSLSLTHQSWRPVIVILQNNNNNNNKKIDLQELCCKRWRAFERWKADDGGDDGGNDLVLLRVWESCDLEEPCLMIEGQKEAVGERAQPQYFHRKQLRQQAEKQACCRRRRSHPKSRRPKKRQFAATRQKDSKPP